MIVINVVGDKEKLKPALQEFISEFEKSYKPAVEKALNSNVVARQLKKLEKYGVAKIPVPKDLDIFMDESDDGFVLRIPLATPSWIRFTRFKSKLKKNLSGFLKAKGIEAKVYVKV